jgi:hypothetical protein
MTGSQFLLLVIVGSLAASIGMALSRYLRRRSSRGDATAEQDKTSQVRER